MFHTLAKPVSERETTAYRPREFLCQEHGASVQGIDYRASRMRTDVSFSRPACRHGTLPDPSMSLVCLKAVLYERSGIAQWVNVVSRAA